MSLLARQASARRGKVYHPPAHPSTALWWCWVAVFWEGFLFSVWYCLIFPHWYIFFPWNSWSNSDIYLNNPISTWSYLAGLEVLSCEKTCQLCSEDTRCCLCFSDPLYFLGTANSSALVEHIPAGGEGCSQEVEEMVWLFSSGLVHFAQGALLLLSIVCGAQVLPGWQFCCIPGGFLPPRISSGAFTAQCFSTSFVPSPVFVHPMNFQMGKAASPRSWAVTEPRRGKKMISLEMAVNNTACCNLLPAVFKYHLVLQAVVWHSTFRSSFLWLVLVQFKCWAPSGNIPSQRLKIMDKQTLQWHYYSKGGFPACATPMHKLLPQLWRFTRRSLAGSSWQKGLGGHRALTREMLKCHPQRKILIQA